MPDTPSPFFSPDPPRSGDPWRGLVDHCLDTGGDEEPPRILGDFELREVVGRGGMGVVWRAWQRGLRREVALKMLSEELAADPDFIDAFRLEAELAAALNHPQIVPVYSVGQTGGRWYYVMELVDGVNLSDLLRERGMIPPREAAGWVRGVAEGMEHAHRRGILHRDLKPSNILIEPGGRARVTDFGLARLACRAARVAMAGHAAGTPHYASPEQASGEETTAAGDVYSLGAVLYHCLTGRPPFTGGTPQEVLEQVIKTPPVAPRRLNPSIPPDLENICLRCLEKEPRLRYHGASALAEDLSRFLENRPVMARKSGWLGRLGRWILREPASAAFALMACLAGGTAVWQARTAGLAARTAAALETERAAAEEERQLSQLHNAASSLAEGNVREAVRTLTDMGSGAEARWGFPFRYLWDNCREGWAHVTPAAHTQKIWALEASPDGNRLATASEDGTVRIWNVADRRCVLTKPFPQGHPFRLQWRPEGDRLLVSSLEGKLHSLNTERGVWEETPPWAEACTISLSRDGKLAATVSAEPFFWDPGSPASVRDPSTGAVLWTCPEPAKTADLSPDGRFLLIGVGRKRGDGSGDREVGVLTVWDWRAGRKTATLVSGIPEGFPRFAAWRSDGLAVCAGINRSVLTWDLAEPTGDSTPVIPAKWTFLCSGGVWVARFTAGGAGILAAASDQSVRLLDARSGRLLSLLRGHHNEVWTATVAANGKTMVSGDKDGSLCWWDWPPPAASPDWPHFSYRSPVLSADGARLFTAGPMNGGGVTLLINPGAPDSRPLEAPRDSLCWDKSRGALVSLNAAERRMEWRRGGEGPVIHSLALTSVPGSRPAVSVNLSPDGSIAWECTPEAIILREVVSGKETRRLPSPPPPLNAAAMSPDNHWFLVSSAVELPVARLYETATGAFTPLKHKSDSVTAVAFSPDSRLAATAGEDAGVRVWNPAHPAEPVTVLEGHLESASGLAFSPDGNYLASSGTGGVIRLWHCRFWRAVLTVPCPDGGQFLMWSDDGRWLGMTLGSANVTGFRLLGPMGPTRREAEF